MLRINFYVFTSKTCRINSKKGEFQYLHDIVHIGYSVQDAQTYLSRHLGNPVSLRLVEILRGEELGIVRQIQVLGKSGRNSYFVRLHRMLPDGSEASFLHHQIWFEQKSLSRIMMAKGFKILFYIPKMKYVFLCPFVVICSSYRVFIVEILRWHAGISCDMMKEPSDNWG